MGGSSQPAVTQQTSTVKLPAWVEQASQENYNFAKDVAGRPLQQYQGQEVADPSSMTTDAYGRIRSLVDMPSSVTQRVSDVSPDYISSATDPYYREAADLYRSSAGPLDIGRYLNPYTDEVVDRSVNNANRALDLRLRNVTDAALKASAFGGSRSAVERGVTSAEGVRGIGDLTAELRRAGFDVASGLATNEMARRAGAAAGMLSTGGAIGASRAGNIAAQTAAQQGQITGEQNTRSNILQNIASLLQGGQQETGYRQSLIDAARRKFYEMRDYPLEQLNTRLAALGMSPYGKTETGYKTATSEDKGPDWATIGLGLGKMAFPGGLGLSSGGTLLGSLAMLSDRDMKTDIEKLGKFAGLDMYAYRYKDDPKSYPKVVGPMAQDIEKKYPKAVKKIGGHRVVDLNNLMEVLQ